jgi:hypothetical protein
MLNPVRGTHGPAYLSRSAMMIATAIPMAKMTAIGSMKHLPARSNPDA